MYVCIFKIYRSAKTTAQKNTPHTFVSDIFTTTHLAPPTSGSRNPNNCTTIVLVTKAHKALVLTDIEHCAYTTRKLSEQRPRCGSGDDVTRVISHVSQVIEKSTLEVREKVGRMNLGPGGGADLLERCGDATSGRSSWYTWR